MGSEQRNHDRFSTTTNAFVGLGQGLTSVGHIQDISRGGLSFEYFAYRNPLDDFQEIQLFASEENFCLTGIPCKIVYDIPNTFQETGFRLKDPLVGKRCGIKFLDLNDGQQTKLKAFLESFTAAAS